MRRGLSRRRSGFPGPPPRGVLVGPSTGVDSVTGRPRAVLDLLDLDAARPAVVRIGLRFPGHGVAFNPRRPGEAVVLQKQGSGGCRLDLAAGSVDRFLAPLPGHAFYGHAAWSADGEALFVVETDVCSGEGVVSVRDGLTFTVLNRFPTGGHAPHDCRLADEGRVLLVTNGGGPAGAGRRPCVSAIDVGAGALVRRYELDDIRRNAGHLAVAADGALAVVSAPRQGLPQQTEPGGVAVGTMGPGLSCLTTPIAVARALVGEALSVAIHVPTRTVAATHPKAGLISFWSLAGDFRGMLAAAEPRGVAVDAGGARFVVSHGADGRLLAVDRASLRAQALDRFGRGLFGGAHLYPMAAP